MTYEELDTAFMEGFQELTSIDTDNFKFVTRTGPEHFSGVVVVIPVLYAKPLSSSPPQYFDEDGNRIREVKCLTTYRLEFIGEAALEYLRLFKEIVNHKEAIEVFDTKGISVDILIDEGLEMTPLVINNAIELTGALTVNVRHTQITVITPENDTIVYATKVSYANTFIINNDGDEKEDAGEVTGFYE